MKNQFFQQQSLFSCILEVFHLHLLFWERNSMIIASNLQNSLKVDTLRWSVYGSLLQLCFQCFHCFKGIVGIYVLNETENISPTPIIVNIIILIISRDLLSLPTLSLLGCFLILCHYFKKLEPVTTFEHTSNDLPKKGLAPSSVSPHNSASRSMKGRKSPLPKLISETELQSQIWSWMDWIWWTAFNCSIGKLLFV